MQVLAVVWTLSVVFAARVAADESSVTTFTSTSGPLTQTFTGSIIAAPSSLPSSPPLNATGSISTTVTSPLDATATPTPTTYVPVIERFSDGVAVGPVVAASVGSSVSASLLVIAAVFLCFRRHRRTTTAAPVESALDATRRCDALEAELRALRAQLMRIEARQLLSSAASGPPITYTNEKDADTLLDGNPMKDGPPIYAD
ncbi:hypothetical protein B0H16DRAFT_166363 [Mycena metata]|uniref:Membrane-associated protein n=1 Tax=Mycena metata TaxID=1033252 RepID=A0AAD7NRJ9_9AGAR|nr:hypothetical protein B0H16DRAFT_166363 [Mycena metata]